MKYIKQMMSYSLKSLISGVMFALGIFAVVYAGNLALSELGNKVEGDKLTLSMWNSLISRVDEKLDQASVSTEVSLGNSDESVPSQKAVKTYVDAQVGAAGGGITFMGYTTALYKGNLGYTKGANDKCNAQYPGSRAMNYDDWLSLGTSYPYTYDVWLLDGSYTIPDQNTTNNYVQKSKDGFSYHSVYYGQVSEMCTGWSSDYNGYSGPSLSTLGRIDLLTCSNTRKLACVKN